MRSSARVFNNTTVSMTHMLFLLCSPLLHLILPFLQTLQQSAVEMARNPRFPMHCTAMRQRGIVAIQISRVCRTILCRMDSHVAALSSMVRREDTPALFLCRCKATYTLPTFNADQHVTLAMCAATNVEQINFVVERGRFPAQAGLCTVTKLMGAWT